jgi:hypothetical protein
MQTRPNRLFIYAKDVMHLTGKQRHVAVNYSNSRNRRQLMPWWNLNVYAGVFNNDYAGLYKDGIEILVVD